MGLVLNMNRPKDPHNKRSEPKKIYRKSEWIDVSNLALNEINTLWASVVNQHYLKNERIIDGPTITDHPSLVYKYEWDNLEYESEMDEWNEAIATYKQELVCWQLFEEERKKGLAAEAKNIDLQIVRTEHRLANLMAVKAGLMLPYPNG